MVKHLARAILALLVIALLMLGALVLWLKQAPRDLEFAKPWLTGLLNPSGAPYHIDIAHVSIDWHHQISYLGRITVTRMTIGEPDGTVFAVIPQVQVTLDPLFLLPRHRGINTVILDSPRLFLARGQDEVVRLGLDTATESLPLNQLLGFFVAGTDKKSAPLALPFRAFEVRNASLSLQDDATDTKLTSTPFAFRIARGPHKSIIGAISMPFTYDKQKGRIDATLSTPATSKDHVLNATLQQFPAQLVCIFADCPNGSSGSGNVSGKLQLTFSDEGFFEGADIAITSGKADLTLPAWFPEPLDFTSADVAAKVTDAGRSIALDHMHFKFPDADISLSGQASKSDAGWAIKAKGGLPLLDMTHLYKYWPLVLVKDTRAWTISKITDGTARDASFTLDVTPQELATHQLKEQSLDGTMKAENITVHYLPGFPPLEHVNGTVHFGGRTMHVVTNSGTMMTGTVVHSAVLDSDLADPHVPMKAVISLSAPAGDVATMLLLPEFPFAHDWGLDPKTATGTADATMTLKFPAVSGRPEDGKVHLDAVDYDIQARLKQVAQPGIFNRPDLAAFDGTLAASNKGLKLDGALGTTEGTGLHMTLTQASGKPVDANFSGRVPRKQFASLGLPDIPQLGEGSVNLSALVTIIKQGLTVKKAILDLTDMVMSIPELSWSKAKGEHGTVTVTAKGEHGYAVAIKARDLDVPDATAETDAEGSLTALHVPHLTTDDNDFALDYTVTKEGYDVDLTGKRLDASTAYAATGGDNHLLENFPPINLHVDLAELALTQETALQEVKGDLDCNRLRCDSAELSAMAGRGHLQAVIDHAAGPRRLHITSDNAGDLIRSLNISDRVYDGTLDFTGTYDDKKQPAPFSGQLRIDHYTLKNSEILGRILSVASISGMANMLTGNGIAFDHMAADIHHLKGMVDVKNGHSSGNSLGITVEGRVDTITSTLDLKGVIVPAYFFNSIVTKIPLIGKLAGGKGEGLIAFNYAVRGKYSDPKVSVNPLSGLTPGFLRGIFGVFHEKKSTDEDAETPAQPAPEPGPDDQVPSLAK